MSLEIDAYLNKLRALLAGNDPATVQDALADAEDVNITVHGFASMLDDLGFEDITPREGPE